MTVSSSLKTVGIDHVVLHVADVERSKAFYVDLLGMSVAHEGGGHTFLRCGEQVVALFQAPAGASVTNGVELTNHMAPAAGRRRACGGEGRAGGARLHRLRPLGRPQLPLLQRPRRPSPPAPPPRRALGAPTPTAVQPFTVDAVADAAPRPWACGRARSCRSTRPSPGSALSRAGRLGLIAALQSAVGRDGTLVMPSMSDDDDHPFDPHTTPCIGMGVVADTFRRLPDVLRSDSPHAFAAAGPLASQIVSPHPLSLPHGLRQPGWPRP